MGSFNNFESPTVAVDEVSREIEETDTIEEESKKLSELKKIINDKIDNEGRVEIHEKMLKFVRLIEKAYGVEKLRKIKLYHFLIGSSYGDEVVEFDLPSNRIENYIRKYL